MTDQAHWTRDTRPPSRLDIVILLAIVALVVGVGAGAALLQHEVELSRRY